MSEQSHESINWEIPSKLSPEEAAIEDNVAELGADIAALDGKWDTTGQPVTDRFDVEKSAQAKYVTRMGLKSIRRTAGMTLEKASRHAPLSDPKSVNGSMYSNQQRS